MNVFREEMHLDRKKFVNLVELILFILVSSGLIIFYLPNFGRFVKFLGEKTD